MNDPADTLYRALCAPARAVTVAACTRPRCKGRTTRWHYADRIESWCDTCHEQLTFPNTEGTGTLRKRG